MPIRHLTWRQIAADLAARIDSGEYPPGEQLPSYRRLAELYSVHVSTISRALGLLHDRGLIEGVAGVGIFVIDQQENGGD
jgi:DNA-binding GntR family transcriptional regulator